MSLNNCLEYTKDKTLNTILTFNQFPFNYNRQLNNKIPKALKKIKHNSLDNKPDFIYLDSNLNVSTEKLYKQNPKDFIIIPVKEIEEYFQY